MASPNNTPNNDNDINLSVSEPTGESPGDGAPRTDKFAAVHAADRILPSVHNHDLSKKPMLGKAKSTVESQQSALKCVNGVFKLINIWPIQEWTEGYVMDDNLPTLFQRGMIQSVSIPIPHNFKDDLPPRTTSPKSSFPGTL